MGRNSGSQIFWTHTHEDEGTATHVCTYYCQQHAEWEQRIGLTAILSIFNLEGHLEGEHGCAEQ